MQRGRGGRKREKQQQSIQQRQSADLSCYEFTPGMAGEGFEAGAGRQLALQSISSGGEP